MLQWLARWSWDRRTRQVSGGQLEATSTFVLRTSKRYRATVTLTGFEQWASNGTIAAKFVELGFKDAKVTGGGGTRQGEATWAGKEKTIPLPIDPHLSNIAEVA
jgi:hypothetical protein